jgi:hypothetical protein
MSFNGGDFGLEVFVGEPSSLCSLKLERLPSEPCPFARFWKTTPRLLRPVIMT